MMLLRTAIIATTALSFTQGMKPRRGTPKDDIIEELTELGLTELGLTGEEIEGLGLEKVKAKYYPNMIYDAIKISPEEFKKEFKGYEEFRKAVMYFRRHCLVGFKKLGPKAYLVEEPKRKWIYDTLKPYIKSTTDKTSRQLANELETLWGSDIDCIQTKLSRKKFTTMEALHEKYPNFKNLEGKCPELWDKIERATATVDNFWHGIIPDLRKHWQNEIKAGLPHLDRTSITELETLSGQELKDIQAMMELSKTLDGQTLRRSYRRTIEKLKSECPTFCRTLLKFLRDEIKKAYLFRN